MRVSSLLAAILSVATATHRAAAEPAASCRPTAVAWLRAAAPDAYATYLRAPIPNSFAVWIDCADAQFGLPTAVHEATHLETNETDAFPLVGGGAVPRPHEMSSFFPPARLAGRFAADDFTATYLVRGKASSATDALYLLDEFNAYTHDSPPPWTSGR